MLFKGYSFNLIVEHYRQNQSKTVRPASIQHKLLCQIIAPYWHNHQHHFESRTTFTMLTTGPFRENCVVRLALQTDDRCEKRRTLSNCNVSLMSIIIATWTITCRTCEDNLAAQCRTQSQCQWSRWHIETAQCLRWYYNTQQPPTRHSSFVYTAQPVTQDEEMRLARVCRDGQTDSGTDSNWLYNLSHS